MYLFFQVMCILKHQSNNAKNIDLAEIMLNFYKL